MYAPSVLVPCTVTPDCWNDSEPPTSTLLTTMLGMTRVIDHMSTRLGSAWSVSCVNTVCLNAEVVSSSGAWPDTTMPSSNPPIDSVRSARDVLSAFTTMFRCSDGRNPGSCARTL